MLLRFLFSLSTSNKCSSSTSHHHHPLGTADSQAYILKILLYLPVTHRGCLCQRASPCSLRHGIKFSLPSSAPSHLSILICHGSTSLSAFVIIALQAEATLSTTSFPCLLVAFIMSSMTHAKLERARILLGRSPPTACLELA